MSQSICTHPLEHRLRYPDKWWEYRGTVSAAFCAAMSVEDRRLHPAAWTERYSTHTYLVEACADCGSGRYFGSGGFVWEANQSEGVMLTFTVATYNGTERRIRAAARGETPSKWFRNKMSEGEIACLAAMRAHDGSPYNCSCAPCAKDRAKLAESGYRLDEYCIARAI